jgi:hypothetical protein
MTFPDPSFASTRGHVAARRRKDGRKRRLAFRTVDIDW